MANLRIALAADHRGFSLKERVKKFLEKEGYKVLDFGTYNKKRCDYPDYGLKAARAIQKRRAQRGVFFCGSGIGMSIVANKVKGIRAGLCMNPDMARLARRDTNTNVLVFAADFVSFKRAVPILRVWLKERFARGRYLKRLRKIPNA